MWILKNSKDLLDKLKSRSFSQVSSIKTSDFSTLYTTLQHDKLKTRLKYFCCPSFTADIIFVSNIEAYLMYKNNNTGQWLKEKSDIEQQHSINDAVAKFKQFNINVKENKKYLYDQRVIHIKDIFQTKFTKVKHATPRNK
jgi:hypothetical protein